MGFLEFEQRCIITGQEQRTSQKGLNYVLINILDDNGKTFSCISDVTIEDLKPLDTYNVRFKVIPGRYLQLRVVGINK